MERKLATVLFVDLVESSALLTAADPEVVRRRITSFFADASECIEHESAGSRDLRGFGDALPVWRALREVDDVPPFGTLEAPFVGREAELDLLQNTFDRAERNRRAHLVTIFGEPGVGK